MLLVERFGIGVLQHDADQVLEFLICWFVETKVQKAEADVAAARRGAV